MRTETDNLQLRAWQSDIHSTCPVCIWGEGPNYTLDMLSGKYHHIENCLAQLVFVQERINTAP